MSDAREKGSLKQRYVQEKVQGQHDSGIMIEKQDCRYHNKQICPCCRNIFLYFFRSIMKDAFAD